MSAYAVFQTGGKQYRVVQDDVLSVEKLAGEAGTSVTFDEVLALGSGDGLTIGTPMVGGASVKAEIMEQYRDKKVLAFKKKRRKGYTRKQGHRQSLTKIKITSIG